MNSKTLKKIIAEQKKQGWVLEHADNLGRLLFHLASDPIKKLLIVDPDTGLLNPSSSSGNMPDMSNAYANDGVVTGQTANGQTQNFLNYGIGVTSGNRVDGIIVRVRANSNGSGTNVNVNVRLSWDGGTSVTSNKNTGALTSSLADYNLGSSTDAWGHGWTTDQLSNTNFQVRVTTRASSGRRGIYDWVAVQIYYTTLGSYFGYASVGGTSNNFGKSDMCACKYTSPADCGTITKISAYMAAYSGTVNATALIYSDNSGVPGNKLATSSEVTGITTTARWVDFTINYSASPNTVYWLALAANADFYFYYDAGSSNQWGYATTFTYGTYDSPWDYITTYQANQQSIYATYTASGTPVNASGTFSMQASGAASVTALTSVPASGSMSLQASGSASVQSGAVNATGTFSISASGAGVVTAGNINAAGTFGIQAVGQATVISGTVSAAGSFGISALESAQVLSGTVSAADSVTLTLSGAAVVASYGAVSAAGQVTMMFDGSSTSVQALVAVPASGSFGIAGVGTATVQAGATAVNASDTFGMQCNGVAYPASVPVSGGPWARREPPEAWSLLRAARDWLEAKTLD